MEQERIEVPNRLLIVSCPKDCGFVGEKEGLLSEMPEHECHPPEPAPLPTG